MVVKEADYLSAMDLGQQRRGAGGGRGRGGWGYTDPVRASRLGVLMGEQRWSGWGRGGVERGAVMSAPQRKEPESVRSNDGSQMWNPDRPAWKGGTTLRWEVFIRRSRLGWAALVPSLFPVLTWCST